MNTNTLSCTCSCKNAYFYKFSTYIIQDKRSPFYTVRIRQARIQLIIQGKTDDLKLHSKAFMVHQYLLSFYIKSVNNLLVHSEYTQSMVFNIENVHKQR